MNLSVSCGKIILSYLLNISQFLLYLISLMHGSEPVKTFAAGIFNRYRTQTPRGTVMPEWHNGHVDTSFCAFCFSRATHITDSNRAPEA